MFPRHPHGRSRTAHGGDTGGGKAKASLAALPPGTGIRRRGFLALPALLTAALAPPWPERGMRCILPFPDGPIGAMARMTLDRMARRLHQPIAYEYRPGATGTIGSDYIARAKPDGYTFGVIGQASHAVLPVLRDLPYDPLKDFAPIGGIASFENVLVVPATSSIRSLDDLIAKAASREAGLLYGSPGIGSAVHLLTELMKIDTGMRLSHVPYTGGTASMTDLLNGRVDLLLVSLPTVADRLRRGQLRPLAMAAAERSLLLPDVPTFAELGYPRIRLSTWIGMAAPDGIPKEALDTLADTLNLSLQEPEVAGRFASLGATPLIDTPDLFINRIASDMAWLREFLPRMGITGQQ